MATKKKNGESTQNKLVWIAGTAVVTALVYYSVNKYLDDRKKLDQLKLAEAMKATP